MCPQRKAICFPLVVYCSTSTHPAARANLRQSRRFLPDQSALFCGILHILGEGGVFLPENRHLRFLLRLLYAALALAGLWLCVRFLLPWLLPFLLAWGLAALLEPAVGLLMRRLRLPRWGAAALCTAALAAAVVNGRCENSAKLILRGGELLIEWDRDKNLIYMTGPAVTVYDGELRI